MRRITGRTRITAIVGGPEQTLTSLSPAMHNAAFEALGLDWIYAPFPVAGDPIPAIRGLVEAGVQGLNVTMPHKTAAARSVDRLEGMAASVGAVNTIEIRAGEIVGHNTDGMGFVRFLVRDLGLRPEGISAMVIGAGGAARALAAALAQAGAATIAIAARDPSKAAGLESLVGHAGFTALRIEEIDGGAISGADLIVNATPLGQKGEKPPFEIDLLHPGVTVVDLVYHPSVTPLVEACRARGILAQNGLGMLLHQAALAFTIWTGAEAPLEVMSAAAVAELARDG